MTGPAVQTKQSISNPNAPKETAQGLSTLRALRESEKILYAKNVSDKPISCRERNGAINVDFLLEVGELAIIPKEALYVKGFIKCWQRHELVISDDEDMENQFLLDLDGRVTESQLMRERAMEALQPNPTNNDIIQVECLMREQHMALGQGGVPVMQRMADKRAGVPPLCDQHKGFAHQFAGTQNPDGTWVFHRVGGVAR